MSDLKKQLKRLKREKKKFQQLQKRERALCPHVSKKGKSWLQEFEEQGVRKGKCKRCGEKVILDRELLKPDTVEMSSNVVKTVLAELKARQHQGDIKLDESLLHIIQEFDAEVLPELSGIMKQMTQKGDIVNRKKKKKKKKRENKRRRWV